MFLRYSIRLSWSILFWTNTWGDLSTHACCWASWGRFFPSDTSIQSLNFRSYINRWSLLQQPLLNLVVYHHIRCLLNLYLRCYDSALSIHCRWLILRFFAWYFFFFSNKFIEYMERKKIYHFFMSTNFIIPPKNNYYSIFSCGIKKYCYQKK